MLGRFRAPSIGIPVLKVPRLQPKRSDTIGLKLTVSRVSDGAIEVAVTTPGRLKTGIPGERGDAVGRRAKSSGSAVRTRTIDGK